VRAGEAYHDVGTLDGYRAAIRMLAERDTDAASARAADAPAPRATTLDGAVPTTDLPGSARAFRSTLQETRG
jgi:hypothetical protein